jgi:hypothetical protein
MAHVPWNVSCGAMLNSEKSVDNDHVWDALDDPRDELDVNDHVHKHSRGGAVLEVPYLHM